MTRIYVRSVAEVPQGYTPMTGKKGGIYYDAIQSVASQRYAEREGTLEDKDFLFPTKVKVEPDIIGSVVKAVDNSYYKITDIRTASRKLPKELWKYGTPLSKELPIVELVDVYGKSVEATLDELPSFIPDNDPQYYDLYFKIKEELNNLKGPWNEQGFDLSLAMIEDQMEEMGNEMTDEMREEIKRIDKELYEAKLDDGRPVYGNNERLEKFALALAERRTLFGDVRIEWFDRIETGTFKNMGPAFLKEQKDLYDSCKKMISVVMQTEDQKVIDATFQGALVFREWTSNNFDQVAPILCEAIQQQVENSRPKYVKRSNEAEEYDNRILKYATKENLLAFKAFSSKIASLVYGDSATIYRGLSTSETLAQLPDILGGTTPKVNGTLYSFSDKDSIAKGFSDISGAFVETSVSTDDIWGGWWVASPRHDAQEREIIIDVPAEGLPVDNHLKDMINDDFESWEGPGRAQKLRQTFHDKVMEPIEHWQKHRGQYDAVVQAVTNEPTEHFQKKLSDSIFNFVQQVTDLYESPEDIIQNVTKRAEKGTLSRMQASSFLAHIDAYRHELWSMSESTVYVSNIDGVPSTLKEGMDKITAHIIQKAKAYENYNSIDEFEKIKHLFKEDGRQREIDRGDEEPEPHPMAEFSSDLEDEDTDTHGAGPFEGLDLNMGEEEEDA